MTTPSVQAKHIQYLPKEFPKEKGTTGSTPASPTLSLVIRTPRSSTTAAATVRDSAAPGTTGNKLIGRLARPGPIAHAAFDRIVIVTVFFVAFLGAQAFLEQAVADRRPTHARGGFQLRAPPTVLGGDRLFEGLIILLQRRVGGDEGIV
jgi:hypothetical protein